MAIVRRNKRLEKMPRKQHTGLYEVMFSIKKKYVKYTTNLGAHIFHLGKLFLLNIKKFGIASGLFIKNKLISIGKLLHNKNKEILDTSKSPVIKDIKKLIAFFKKVISEGKKSGVKGALSFFAHDTYKSFRHSKNKFATVVNYACPVVALVFFISLVSFGVKTQYALSVECDGHIIGYVEKEAEYAQAQKLMQDRITYVDGDQEIKVEPTLSVQKISSSKKLISVSQLTDNMINHTDTPVIDAYGLYINDQFVGAVSDKTAVQNDLDTKLKAYRDANPDGNVQFVDKVEFKDGIYLENGMKTSDDLIGLIDSQKQVEAYYTVVNGDTPTGIADKVNVPYAQIKALNPTIEEKIFPGQQILLNQAKPYLSVKVTKTENYDVSIPYETVTVDNSSALKGTKKTVTTGVNGVSNVTADVTYVDGAETSRNITASVVTSEPVTEKVSVGTKVVTTSKAGANAGAIAASGGGYLWPVNGGYISSGYGYRGRSFHSGIDIAAPSGTAIYAAASGTVTKAGYGACGSGYGNSIQISHGGGYSTLYAHASRIYVSVGQYVNKGDLIAAVGQTGQATGNHLHFEVRSGSTKLNPSNYVGK